MNRQIVKSILTEKQPLAGLNIPEYSIKDNAILELPKTGLPLNMEILMEFHLQQQYFQESCFYKTEK